MRGGAEAGAGPLSLIPGLFVSLWSLMSLTVWLSFPGYLFDTVGGASAKLQAHSLLSTVPAGQAGQPGHAPREMGQGCVSWDMAPWVRGVLGSELEQPPPVFIFSLEKQRACVLSEPPSPLVLGVVPIIQKSKGDTA